MILTSFYQFLPVNGLPLLRCRMETRARDAGVLGTVLIAPEGINGSLTGPDEAVTGLLDWLSAQIGADSWVVNRQAVENPPFRRLKVRIRPEIIRFDQPDPNLATRVGRHIPPGQWNDLIRREDVRVIDTRNDYEVRLGSFEGAENPGTDTFRDFARWVDEHLDPETDRNVAMFCTGGVRCEKASAWLAEKGFDNVFQLKGGILSYLDEVPVEESCWQGECFVFDDRVSIDHRLRPTGRSLCQACRRPAEALDAAGLPPVDESTRRCLDCGQAIDSRRLAGLRERARQVRLARQKGKEHLGPQD